jgi:hypothetical protein
MARQAVASAAAQWRHVVAVGGRAGGGDLERSMGIGELRCGCSMWTADRERGVWPSIGELESRIGPILD